jgi:hypothetical protein
LGWKEIVVPVGEIAHFRDITFSGADFSDLRHGRYYITVNAHSAREKSPRGLLGCSAIDAPAETIIGKVVQITCTP